MWILKNTHLQNDICKHIQVAYKHINCTQCQIQVLWGLQLMHFLRPSLWKRVQNYEYRIGYKREYLFTVPPRTLEGSHASEVPWNLSFISFIIIPPLTLPFKLFKLMDSQVLVSKLSAELFVNRYSLSWTRTCPWFM